MSNKENETILYDVEMGSDDDSWNSYQRLILAEITRQGQALKSLGDKLDAVRTADIPSLKVEIARLQLKSGIVGLIAGLVPVLIAVLIKYL